MKKLFFVATLVALAIGCKQQTNTFTIQGTLADTTGSNGKMVFLQNQSGWHNIDTCMIKDGKFSFTGNIDSLVFLNVQYENMDAEYIPESGITHIMFSEDNSVVSGTLLNETLQTYTQKCDSLYEEVRKKIVLTKSDSSLIDDLKKSQVQTLWNGFSSDLHTIRESYFAANSKNNVGLHVLINMLQYDEIATVAQLDSLITRMNPKLTKYKGLHWWRDRMIGAAATQVGSPFADFNGFLLDGTKIKLSDFVGKGNYVLADFWGAGCPPCVDELPVLREVYSKYKEKGFLLIGINNINTKPSVSEAIRELDISWPQICTFTDDTPAVKYGVSGVPHILLFAPDGTIVARDLRGDEIREKLTEVYAPKQ